MFFHKEMVKGFFLCFLVGVISIFIANFFPYLGATSIAIILGIVVGNTLGKDKKFQPGIVFSEKKILTWAITLLGFSLNLKSITSLGLPAVILILLSMIFTVFSNYIIGTLLGFSKTFSLLLGAGNAVCGSSAIAATSKALTDSDEEEIGLAVAIVNLIGTISMFILPFIALHLIHMTIIHSGALIGGGLQSVGQVVVGGNFLGDEVEKFAILFKMIRISFLGVVVLIYSLINRYISEKNREVITDKGKKKFSFPIPLFIIIFFIFSFLTTSHLITGKALYIFSKLSHYLLIIAMAGIGMRIQVSQLIKDGPKALTFGVIAMVAQVLFLITIIKYIL